MSSANRTQMTASSPTPGYVLVVEDEDVTRRFLARSLEGAGHVTKEASNAAEALELMIGRAAAAVVCDIRMPGHSGLWLAERLHTHWPHTPIILATAIDDAETVRESRQLGVAEYLTKPISAERLVEAVQRTIAAATAPPPERAVPATRPSASESHAFEAEYTLESPVRCPACGERVTTLAAVRLIRAQVNFTSTLPRRGRVVVCPHCLAMAPAELSNF